MKIYTLLLNLLLGALTFKGSAQNIGMGVETNISSNGHGTYYSGYISLNKGKGSVKLGACIQQRGMKMNGLRLGYSLKLAGLDQETTTALYDDLPNGSVVLNAFSYAQYLNDASLSSRRAKVESLTQLEGNRNWNTVKMSTAEAGIGIELTVKLSDWVQLRNFISLSGYYHVDYIQGMYQERMMPVINIGTGINIPGF
jgi:hypothetical protein